MEKNQQRRRLCRLLDVAFTNVAYPSRTRLVVSVPSQYEYDPDRQEVLALLRGKTWTQLLAHFNTLSETQFNHYEMAIWLMTPEAFAAYLHKTKYRFR